MKYNKILSFALVLPALAALFSCADEADYTPAAPVGGPQVYFDENVKTDWTITSAEPKFSFDLTRVATDAEADVVLKMEVDEASQSVFNIPSAAVFQAGSKTATVECLVNTEAMEYDKPYKVTVSIAKSDEVTIYAQSSVTFTVTLPEPWKSLGKATFVDGIITSIFSGVAEDPYEVEILENELVPGLYRLVNPYTKAYPLYPSESIIFDDTKDYYLEIHAEDPEAVWFGKTDLGLDMGYGKISAISIADFYVQRGDDPALVKERGDYGTLKDGEITFPVKGILYTMPKHPNGEGWYYANTNGQFSILLPGYVKGDYSASLEYAGIFTAKDGKVYATGMLTLGADATDVKAIVMPADADAAAVADAIAAGELEAVKVEKGRIEVSFDAEELGGNNFQIIAVVMSDGAVKTVAAASFEYYGGGKSPWQSIGTGYYTDDILSSGWGLPPVTYEVEVLENNENPGLYRLVNPYNNKVYPAEYVQVFAEQLGNSLAPEGYYLEVNAMDAEGVYIQPQALGLDFSDGEWAFATMGGYYLANDYPFDMVKENRYLGSVVEGVIKFPVLGYEDQQGEVRAYQGVLYKGANGPYYCAFNGKVEIVLPGANAFARNMAKAKTNTTKRSAIKKSFFSAKDGLKFNRILKRAVEVCATPNF